MDDSGLKSGTGSENGSDKSNETIEIVGYPDTESASSGKSSEELIPSLPETVTMLTYTPTGAIVYLVGTAHFSKNSHDDVRQVIRQVRPHLVLLELCPERTSILEIDENTLQEEAKGISMAKIIQTIKQSGFVNGLIYILMLSISADTTRKIGMAPGIEFRVAYQEALRNPNCLVHLGDRPISITMRRALSRLSWFETLTLAWRLLTNKDEVTVEEIERCKNEDIIEQLLADMNGENPVLQEVFLHERDIFLTYTLQAASKLRPPISSTGDLIPEPMRIVGVVGLAHIRGIVKLWPIEQQAFVSEIMTVPPPTLASKIFNVTLKISLLGFGGYIIYKVVPVPKIVKENTTNLLQKLAESIRSSATKMFLQLTQ
ncbi:hypothetical protein ABEB36_011938 [Hypothenemus hampei]